MDDWETSLGYVRGSNIYVRGYLDLQCLVFKTTYVDREKPLREGAFFFTRMTLFLPLNKRNTRDKAKGLLGLFGEIYRGAGRAIPYWFVHGITTALMANEYDCISDLYSFTLLLLKKEVTCCGFSLPLDM